MNKRPKKDMSRNLPGSRVTQTPAGFSRLLKEVKARIQQSQMRAVLSANAELVRLYWDIGRMIDQRQQQEGWGAAVIPRLARELHNELPQVKGFSERNIKRMLAFYRAYPSPAAFLSLAAAKLPDGENSPESAAHIERSPKVPQAVALLAATKKMPQAVAQIASANESILWSIPRGHHAWLMDKVDVELRHQTDAPSIGLILCQDRNQIVAEYALRGADRPIGVSQYELTRALPASLKSALPTVEEIEAELSETVSEHPSPQPALPASADRKAAAKSKPHRKKPPKKGRKT